MPQYAMLASHEPDSCPGANKKVQQFAEKTLGRLPEIGTALGVNLQQMLHLDPGHKTLGLLEAPSVEAVRDFILEAGLDQWNNIEVFPVTPVAELMEKVADRPRLYS